MAGNVRYVKSIAHRIDVSEIFVGVDDSKHRFEYAYKMVRLRNGLEEKWYNPRCKCGWYEREHPLHRSGQWYRIRAYAKKAWVKHALSTRENQQRSLAIGAENSSTDTPEV